MTASIDVCMCGQPLPRHLADVLADLRDDLKYKAYAHICSCERVWRLQGSCFVHTPGDTKVNPFTDFRI